MTECDPEWGPVETAVRDDLGALSGCGETGTALTLTAYRLARALDMAEPKECASVARELRATLREIREAGSDADDVDAFLAGLSSQVGNSSA